MVSWLKTKWQWFLGVFLVGLVSLMADGLQVIDRGRGFFARLGSVEFNAAYPDEIWRTVERPDYPWMRQRWCYSTLPGLRTEFRMRSGVLERRNSMSGPDGFVSDWVPAKVLESDRGVVALNYENQWPHDFLTADEVAPGELREHQRFGRSNNELESGDYRLMLDCDRCRVDEARGTYSCAE